MENKVGLRGGFGGFWVSDTVSRRRVSGFAGESRTANCTNDADGDLGIWDAGNQELRARVFSDQGWE